MKSDLPNGFETISLQEGRHWVGRVIMCVDLNAFYPSCEELRDPTLKGKPHAVIMTDQKEGITKGLFLLVLTRQESMGSGQPCRCLRPSRCVQT